MMSAHYLLMLGKNGSASGSSGGADPLTKLLLAFDGLNGSTSFPDASGNGHTFTTPGNSFIDTSVSKFGGASLHIQPSLGNAGLLGDGGAGQALGSGNFVVDFWYQPIALPAGANNSPLIDWGHDTSPTTCPGLWIGSDGTTFWVCASGTNLTSPALVVGTMYHLAVVKSSNILRIFTNGVNVNRFGTDFPDTNTYSLIAGAPAIGITPSNLQSSDAFFDEVRISVGTDRGWFNGFTPPTAPY